jgi:hypothetical protein
MFITIIHVKYDVNFQTHVIFQLNPYYIAYFKGEGKSCLIKKKTE